MNNYPPGFDEIELNLQDDDEGDDEEFCEDIDIETWLDNNL